MENKQQSLNGCYILDENNNPIPCNDFKDWALWLVANGARVRVAYTEGKWASISTVFVGLAPGGITLGLKLWESLVKRKGRHNFIQRWSSYEEAVAGHKELCDQYLQEDS